MENITGKHRHLLLIGAQKCGTSSLFHLLVTHPDILPSTKKEPEFFSRSQGHRKNDILEYTDLWPGRDKVPGAYLLEASTGYTKYPEEIGVAQRIFEADIDPHFIYVTRDPFKRIESHFNWGIG